MTNSTSPSKPLPLDNLDRNFLVADALLTPDGQPANWPRADVIIGNPPFIGAKMLKPERGPDYVNAVRRAYPDVPGMADYCVYWFRKAHDHLPPCTAADPVAGRAGLVGTQNIRNNQSRVGGLDYIAQTGTIIEAVENQPWSGEANVHVSIANWVKTQDAALLPKTRKLWFKVEPTAAAKKLRKRGTGPASKDYELDFRECDYINSALVRSDRREFRQRLWNAIGVPNAVLQGQQPGHDGFLIDRRRACQAPERGGCSRCPLLLRQRDGLADRRHFSAIASSSTSETGICSKRRLSRGAGDRAPARAGRLAEGRGGGAARDWQDCGEHQGRVETWWQSESPPPGTARCH